MKKTSTKKEIERRSTKKVTKKVATKKAKIEWYIDLQFHISSDTNWDIVASKKDFGNVKVDQMTMETIVKALSYVSAKTLWDVTKWTTVPVRFALRKLAEKIIMLSMKM